MSIDKTASALNDALRAFGETLGRALAEGIALGVQEGLAQSLDLERLTDGTALPGRSASAARLPPARRRGGRPKSEPKPCRIPDCPDPARSRGLCSRHYQQELRREKAEMAQAIRVSPPPSAPITARPPIVRKRGDEVEPVVIPPPAEEPRQAAAPTAQEPPKNEPRTSPIDAAKRVFG